MTGMGWACRTGLVAAGTLGLAGAGLSYGFWEAHQFTLRRVAVPVLEPGSAPIRILHISDLHLMPGQRLKQEWVSRLAGLEPDLVVDTGDNFCTDAALEPLLDCLSGLLARPGVFVFGSNDYLKATFSNPLEYLLRGRSHQRTGMPAELDHERLRDAFTGAGWLDLDDQRGRLTVAGRTIAFRGTDDAHHDRDHYDRVAGPAESDADLTIGVTHAPYLRVLDAMAYDGMDLILAGHTHGGQVCLPLKGAIVTNCDLDPARVRGLSTHRAGDHTSWLHVSAGLGTSPFAPYRTFCRPEASLLTLVPRQD